MPQAKVMTLPQTVNRHKHDHYQLVMGLTGSAEIDMCGLAAHLDVTHGCVVPSDTYHDFFGRPHNHVLVINIEETSAAFHDNAHPDYEILNPLFESPRLLSLDQGMRQLTQVCIQEIQRAESDQALRHHMACSIIRCLSRRILPDTKPVKSPLLDINRIEQYVSQHLHERISIHDMADCICVSERHFHQLFKEQTGQTPHQYVIRKRLDYAARLLRETPLAIADISQKCGFSSQSALTNAMRKYEGTTPRRVRHSLN